MTIALREITALSRDGHQVAVAIGHSYEENSEDASIGKIALVDAGERAIVDAGDATAGADLIDLPDDIRSSQCAFSWSGDRLVCNNSWEAQCDLLAVVDLTASSLDVESVDVDEAEDCNEKAMQFVPTSDGKIWLIGDYAGLTRLAADNTIERLGTESIYGTSAFIADESPDKLVLMSYQRLYVYDLATGDLNFNTSGNAASSYGHSVGVTPY